MIGGVAPHARPADPNIHDLSRIPAPRIEERFTVPLAASHPTVRQVEALCAASRKSGTVKRSSAGMARIDVKMNCDAGPWEGARISMSAARGSIESSP